MAVRAMRVEGAAVQAGATPLIAAAWQGTFWCGPCRGKQSGMHHKGTKTQRYFITVSQVALCLCAFVVIFSRKVIQRQFFGHGADAGAHMARIFPHLPVMNRFQSAAAIDASR